MVLHAKQIFNEVYLDREQPSDFIKYVSYGVKRELITKVMDKFKDHKFYAVQLLEPESIHDSRTREIEYRQDLNCLEIVQCKNCRMNFPWCWKFRDELGGNGFCPYGAEIIVEDKDE